MPGFTRRRAWAAALAVLVLLAAAFWLFGRSPAGGQPTLEDAVELVERQTQAMAKLDEAFTEQFGRLGLDEAVSPRALASDVGRRRAHDVITQAHAHVAAHEQRTSALAADLVANVRALPLASGGREKFLGALDTVSAEAAKQRAQWFGILRDFLTETTALVEFVAKKGAAVTLRNGTLVFQDPKDTHEYVVRRRTLSGLARREEIITDRRSRQAQQALKTLRALAKR